MVGIGARLGKTPKYDSHLSLRYPPGSLARSLGVFIRQKVYLPSAKAGKCYSMREQDAEESTHTGQTPAKKPSGI